MDFIPFENVARAELVFNFENSIVENVLHYQRDSSWNDEALADCASSLMAVWEDFLAARLTSAISLVNIIVTDLETETGHKIEQAPTAPIPGEGIADPMPANVACQVTWLTGLRGRSFRGRIYVCGIGEGQALGSRFIDQFLSDMATAYGHLISLGFSGEVGQLVVASSYHNKVRRTVGVATPVTGLRVGPVVVSQRRRLPGRGQ